jgi:hypothetical protein
MSAEDCMVCTRISTQQYREGPVGAYPKDVRDAPEHAFDPSRHRSVIDAIGAELRSLR